VVADIAEHLLLFPESLHGLERPRRLKAVIGRNQLEQPAVHASGVVDPGERDLGSELDVLAVVLRASGKRNDDPEADLVIADAMHIARRKRLGRRDGGVGRGGSDRVSQRRRGGRRRRCAKGLLEAGDLTVRDPAIRLSRRHGGAPVGDGAVQETRKVGAVGVIG
jgi:hypothetical protein